MGHPFSRRSVLIGAAAALAAPKLRAAAPETPPLFDHMLLACNDLDKGIAFVEQKLGVRAAMGGVHPGRGSRNALLALGDRRYLEIIAPDPAQPRTSDVRELYKIQSARLIGWAAHVDDISAVQKRLSAAGVGFQPVRDGSRKRPSGEMLRWKALSLEDDQGGLAPFFIEWAKDSPHPSSDAPQGGGLSSFALATPEAGRIGALLAQLGVEVSVATARPAGLRAKLEGPKGTLSLPT
jgi:catechol 2,3-dioxygenase-like lactoylglutathione lyase family enzyme